jgi:hypothetical protein
MYVIHGTPLLCSLLLVDITTTMIDLLSAFFFFPTVIYETGDVFWDLRRTPPACAR